MQTWWVPLATSAISLGAVVLAWALGRWREREHWEQQVRLEREKRDAAVLRDAVIEFLSLAERIVNLVWEGHLDMLPDGRNWEQEAFDLMDQMAPARVQLQLLAPKVAMHCEVTRVAAVGIIGDSPDWSKRKAEFDHRLEALYKVARAELNLPEVDLSPVKRG